MITNSVTFLLGAGASCGYGFPTGGELKNDIAVLSSDVLNALPSVGIDQNFAQLFANDLRESNLRSVDAFLRHRPEYAQLAKLRIAEVLGNAEKTGNLIGTCAVKNFSESWYQCLYADLMYSRTLDAFANNRCGFITLNYDRSLEFALTNSLRATFGARWEECAAVVAQIPIIHLHGSLGNLPGFGEKPTGYGDIRSFPLVRSAADAVFTIDEARGKDAYRMAEALIQKSDCVISLGFGYHAEVIETLGLNRNEPRVVVYGTCQGLTQAEVEFQVTKRFGNNRFAEYQAPSSGPSRGPVPVVDYLRHNIGSFHVDL